ncbi:MAG: esterase [Anaerolineae bacterium]|nr:esterase [Anaerolineae bacterium]
MTVLITTLGNISIEDLPEGIVLPHEHIFVDLRKPDHPDQGQAPVDEVVALMAPELRRAAVAGVCALVECTPVGVGRRADFDIAVSKAAGVPVLLPTGVYREPWIPPWVHAASEADLTTWMVGELREGIEDTGICAAWIKLSAGDDGITRGERKVLRAAAVAGLMTGAVIGSHTIRGKVLLEQLDAVEDVGYTAKRFIWIHTQAEPDFGLHLAAAARGAWIEYDAIGTEGFSDEAAIDLILRILDAGYGDQLLLSHDRGWYDPAKPGGGTPRPFTYIPDHFLPKLATAGFDEETVARLTRTNPFRAFGR